MNSKGYYEQKGKDPLERSSIYTLSRNDFFEMKWKARIGSNSRSDGWPVNQVLLCFLSRSFALNTLFSFISQFPFSQYPVWALEHWEDLLFMQLKGWTGHCSRYWEAYSTKNSRKFTSGTLLFPRVARSRLSLHHHPRAKLRSSLRRGIAPVLRYNLYRKGFRACFHHFVLLFLSLWRKNETMAQGRPSCLVLSIWYGLLRVGSTQS